MDGHNKDHILKPPIPNVGHQEYILPSPPPITTMKSGQVATFDGLIKDFHFLTISMGRFSEPRFSRKSQILEKQNLNIILE